jgi:HEAT repeat protein
LVERFKTTSPFWRQADVAKEIAGLKNPQALTALASWLTHEDRHIRANVAFVFAALGDPRGLQALEAIIDDRSDRSEGQGIPGAKWSLAKQILSDRYYAVHVLGELKDKSSLGILVRLLADEQVNYKAIWALGEIGDARAIPPVIRMLQDRDAHTRITAIQTLETLHAREALPDLRAMVDDPALPNAGDQIPVGQVAARAIAVLEKRR